jgi:serine/threonine protein kinase
VSEAHTAYNDPRIGSVILGRYRLVRYLAAGGMGAIYLARAEGAAGFVRPVVIKRSLRVGDDQAGKMFAREARILSQLRHPGIVSIHDFAEDGGDYVMVLDYVHGYTLSDWAKYLRRSQRVLPVEIAVSVMVRVLDALHYAHTLRDPSGDLLGVVHRDVKPSNVLVDVQGDVKLADFGIARTDIEATEVSVNDTTLKGTFPYMAPELFARAKPNPGTDVYSAAVTLYSVLTGSNPFSSSDVAMTVGRVLHHEPELVHNLRKDVPEAVGWAIANGMSKMAELRFSTAEAFASALRATGIVDGIEGRFRSVVGADFSDGAFAELLGVSSLAERAEAWSQQAGPGDRGLALPLPPPDPTMHRSLSMTAGLPGDLTQDEPPRPVDFPTSAAGPVALGRGLTDAGTGTGNRFLDATDAIRPRRTLPIVVAIAAGLGAAAAVLWLTLGRSPAPPAEPTVVVVRGDVAVEGEDVPAPTPTAPVAAAAPGDAGVDAPPVAAPAPAPTARDRDPRQPSNSDLTQAVRKRQSLITACVERHTSGVSSPEMSFRFQVDRRGKVTAVELLPASIAPSPLGRCLLEVARGTSFGPLAKPVTFRIPITVRRQ